MRTLSLIFLASVFLLGCGDDGPPTGDTGIVFDAAPMDAPPVGDSALDGSGDSTVPTDTGLVDSGMLSPECYAPAMETELDVRFPWDPVGVDVSPDTAAFDVAYIDFETALALRRFGEDGAPEGAARTPLPRSGFYNFPSLSRTSTDLALAYLTNDPGRWEVRVATRDTGSIAFRPPTSLSGSGEIGGRAIVGGLEGVGFAVAYTVRDAGGTGWRLYYVRVDRSGSTLEAPTEVASGVSAQGFDLARDGEGTAVVWKSADASGTTIWARPTDTDGVLMATDVEIVAGRRITGRPAAVRVTGNGTLVAWAETVGGARSEIHALLVQDAGSMFTERIVSGIEQGSEPDLSAMPLAVGLAYRGIATDGPSLRFNILTFDGEPLIDPMTIGATDSMGGEVAIGASLDARSFGIAWTDMVDSSLVTRFVAVRCGG